MSVVKSKRGWDALLEGEARAGLEARGPARRS